MKLKQIFAAFAMTVTVAVSAQTVTTHEQDAVVSVATSPAQLLRGELSGVRVSSIDGNPNGMLNVNVRGLNTLRGDSQPLYIVDGAVIGTYSRHNLDAFYLSGGTNINGESLPDYSGEYYTAPLGNFGWLNLNDIESIEVLKDVAATSIYGMQGANGVVIIKTRRPSSGEHNVRWNSNVGVDLAARKGDAFKIGVVTTHDVALNGLFGAGSYYNISGFIRHNNASIRNTRSTSGGLTLNLETAASELIQFGMNSRLGYGNHNSAAGVNHIGSASAMMLSRYPEAFAGDNLTGWTGSYDDKSIDYRTVNSVWLNINFLKTLKLKVEGGLDYQTQNRYIWLGSGTSFGDYSEGAAGILNNSLLNYNFKAELKFDRSFAVKHHLQAALNFDINGWDNKTNAMCGTKFDMPYLKAKGITSSGSIKSLRKFAKKYNVLGGHVFLSYDYDGYAGVSGAARIDHSFRFYKAPVWLPSAQAFVDFKKILLSDDQLFSTLKLTGGYGWAGREVVFPYEYLYAYTDDIPEVAAGTQPYFDSMSRLISREYNIGVNLGFINDRFNVSLKYFDKSTDDIIRVYNFGKILVDDKGQQGSLWNETKNWQIHRQQSDILRNSGVELDADFRIIGTKRTLWDLWVNAAYNFKDNTVYGTMPKLYGGLGTSLSMFGFTLSAKFTAASMFNVVNANRMVEDKTLTFEDCLERGDYLRLENVSLSYKIPSKVRWIKDLKVNVSAHNLFTVTGYSGWNPDVNCFGVMSKDHGVDYGSFPLCRQIVAGVSFRF